MSNIAIITGGNRGIGLGISEKLIDEGWSVAVCATRSESECEEVLAKLRNRIKDAETAKERVAYFQMNVADADARKNAFNAIVERFGKINLLVNNAGVAPLQRRDVLEMSVESFHRVMQINLEGPFFLTQAVANLMVRQRNSDSPLRDEPMVIVNVSSISATVASISRGEYCLSKAGVSMATQLWAARLAAEKIPVYEVRPGIIHSDMTEAVREKYDRLIAEGLVPQLRWGTPEDVGAAVAMLARGDLPYSTGQVIMVDGGQTIPRL